MSLGTFLARLLLALLLGSLIGVERQWHRRLSDLKTSALVALGAALFMMGAATAGGGWDDPMRVAGQIVVGVGFIGGGLLFRDGGQPRGINTAATLWCAAGIGILCALGRGLEAASATALLAGANTVLRRVARRLRLRMGLDDSVSERVAFEIVCPPAHAGDVLDELEAALGARHAELHAVTQARSPEGATRLTVVAAFESADLRVDIDAVLDKIDGRKTDTVSWRRL